MDEYTKGNVQENVSWNEKTFPISLNGKSSSGDSQQDCRLLESEVCLYNMYLKYIN